VEKKLSTSVKQFVSRIPFVKLMARYVKRVWWLIRRKINPPRLPSNADGRVCLHLGCGSINAPGYINVDVKPLPHIHYVHPITSLEMFVDNQVDLVYISHVLEHLSVVEAERALKEWHRILKPGGILRIGVPDFKILVSIYQDTEDIKAILGPLMGGQIDAHNFHQSVYDEAYLQELLYKIGFREVRHWDPGSVGDHDFEDSTSLLWEVNGKEYPISLNMEAVK